MKLIQKAPDQLDEDGKPLRKQEPDAKLAGQYVVKHGRIVIPVLDDEGKPKFNDGRPMQDHALPGAVVDLDAWEAQDLLAHGIVEPTGEAKRARRRAA